MNETGKEMNESRGHSGFDYESFRQETIAKMLAGDKELTGKDGLDNRILSLYSKGMSYEDIKQRFQRKNKVFHYGW